MKSRSLVAALAASVPLLLAAPAAQAAVFVYEATLSGPNEAPPRRFARHRLGHRYL